MDRPRLAAVPAEADEEQEALAALVAQRKAQAAMDELERQAALGFVTDYYRR